MQVLSATAAAAALCGVVSAARTQRAGAKVVRLAEERTLRPTNSIPEKRKQT